MIGGRGPQRAGLRRIGRERIESGENRAVGRNRRRGGHAVGGDWARDRREIVLHGQRVSYRSAGSGDVVVLVHGVGGSAAHWESVFHMLSRDHLVIAPDLLGHGASAKPRGDYSLGAYASGIRDLLVMLGHTRATVVGHSLGGGIAMQFAYQFFGRCERLVLVSSGGLGPDVHPLLRAAAVPGVEWLLPLVCNVPLRDAGRAAGRVLRRIGVPTPSGPSAREFGAGYTSLAEAEARSAFVHTLRSVVDVQGQRVDARDRLYLAGSVPVLIIWGAHDPVIPVAHAAAAHEQLPGSRLEIFDRAGHFPQWDDPERFAATVADFLATTAAADLDDDDFRDYLLAENGATPRRDTPAP
jgi:pimeloyl-ACP methyl ester carboxylesterase